MKVCYTGGAVKDCGSYYSVATNAVELRIWFLTDDILRIRAGFDGDWDEASYSLTMTAWESRTDELMKDCRKRVQSAAAALTDGDRQAVIQGARLKVVIEKAPFRIMVYDKDGSLLHADIPDLAYREDSNHRRIHASQIEADDCFYGFGEKSGEINKAEKYMNMAPGDAMGYNAKETDSLYKHIPFYIRLNRGTKQAVGYFYHNTAECDFNMGREKRNYWHGLPIWQPTFSVFQNDPATYDEGVDFMFGDSLLVANVVEKGQTVRPVYLPVTENENERFYDFYTREEYAPGQTIEVPVDIASIPLFVRSGAILPMSGNKLHNLMTEKTTALDILMAPDVDSEFTLYEDDGRTNDYRKGAYLKTKIAVKAGVKTVVTFTNEGSYETAVESMYLDMIHREKSPFYVQVDGKELPHFLHRRKFEEAESGWYYSQRLKSVQIKYPNPKKDHEVLVSFEQFDLIGM